MPNDHPARCALLPRHGRSGLDINRIFHGRALPVTGARTKLSGQDP